MDLISSGQAALRRGDWQEARSSFSKALASGRSADALEGLGWALWWLDEPVESLDLRTEAYALVRREGDDRRAARIAMSLAVDFADARNESAVASGWMARARRLLSGLPEGAEHGWLALWEGHLARLVTGDPAEARRHGEEALAIARRLSLTDLEMLALALEGLVRVGEGRIGEGMRLLDEATAAAVAGEMSDLDAIGTTCCFLIHACEKVKDHDRALQWADRMRAFCARWNVRPLLTVCRTYLASALMWSGGWERAEAELLAARSTSATRPHMAVAVDVRLAELRRRQGRDAEARALFETAPEHPLSLLGRAALALDDGRAGKAGGAGEAERLLARFFQVASPDDALDRAVGTGLLVECRLAGADLPGARSALSELEALEAAFPAEPVRALRLLAEGLVALAAGSEARPSLEGAAAAFTASGGVLEAARSRLELGRALRASGRAAEARAEIARSIEAFSSLGASRLERTARALLEDKPPAPGPSRLTARERDVLRLVAEGLADREIAERLGVSEHTVHRHVANLLRRLDVRSRSAAVGKALRERLL
ncbi:MAG: helix-turn-helix domain-containing protein [Acidobacteria bacterium]|nr:helix-turn-helix domain-containing protein [Acidobacteriota bacterium]